MALLTNKRSLIVAAHCDDVELSCGGTLLATPARRAYALVLVGGKCKHRRRICEANLENLGVVAVYMDQPDCAVPVSAATVARIEEAIDEAGAEVVITHASDDTHQDHRAVRAMAETALRRRPISLVEMDSPSVTPTWQPNCWQPIDADAKERLLDPYRPHVGEDLIRWWGCPDSVASVRGVPACERYRIVQWWESR